MDENTKEEIGRVMREEITQNTRNGTASNLFKRNQNIIRNVASEVAGSSSGGGTRRYQEANHVNFMIH